MRTRIRHLAQACVGICLLVTLLGCGPKPGPDPSKIPPPTGAPAPGVKVEPGKPGLQSGAMQPNS